MASVSLCKKGFRDSNYCLIILFLYYTNSLDKTLINSFNLAFGRAPGPQGKTFEGKGAEPERDSRGGAREGGGEEVTSAIREQRGMVTSGHRMPGRAPGHGADEG